MSAPVYLHEVLVSSVRVETGPSHDTIRVWNRGGLAGTLTVKAGDGQAFAARLLADEELERCEGCPVWVRSEDAFRDADGIVLCDSCAAALQREANDPHRDGVL